MIVGKFLRYCVMQRAARDGTKAMHLKLLLIPGEGHEHLGGRGARGDRHPLARPFLKEAICLFPQEQYPSIVGEANASCALGGRVPCREISVLVDAGDFLEREE